MHTLTGGCHCGRVRFRAEVEVLEAYDCNCSICTKKGFLHVIVPKERFQALHDPAELCTYAFNTGVARHFFCRTCGVHAYYVPRSHPDGIDINLRCVDGYPLEGFSVLPFDGRNWEQAAPARFGADPSRSGRS